MSTLDTTTLIAALDALRPPLEALSTKGGVVAKVETLVERFSGAPTEFFEGLDTVEASVSAPEAYFGFAMVLAHALGDARTPTVVEGDLDVGAPFIVYEGDLKVTGRLSFNGVLVVLGDLEVGGVLQDSMEWSSVWVTGNLAVKAAKLGAKAWIGGAAQAELVLLSRRGRWSAVGGTKAKVALRNDFDGDGFVGRLDAEHHLDIDRDPERVKATMMPEFVDDEGMIEDEDEVVEALLEGRPILR